MRSPRPHYAEGKSCSRDLLRGNGGYQAAEVRDIRKIGGVRGLAGKAKKKWMECLLDDLRAFGINADQCTTAAQDEGGWPKTAKQGK